jgi:DNA invertase Pin-like site-specific DNA recombinase
MTNSATRAQPLSEAARSKRAVVFTRTRSVPHDPEADQVRLAAQRSYCQRVAQELGATVVSTYAAIGGASQPEVRHLVEKLLREVDGGGFDYVIVQSLDRLARRSECLGRIAQRLSAARARLVTTADPAEAFRQDVVLFCLVAKLNERRTK